MPEQRKPQPAEKRIPPASELWQIPGVVVAVIVFLVAAYIARHPILRPARIDSDAAALKMAYESGSRATAASSAEKFLSRYPASPYEAFARFVLADSRWELVKSNPATTTRELSDCLTFYRTARLLGLAPAYESRVLRGEGDIFARLGMASEALDSYTALVDKYPSESRALVDIALAHFKTKPASLAKAEEALDRYMNAPGLSPGETQAGYIARARLEIARKAYKDAAASCEKVIAAGPSGEIAAETAIILAEALSLQGDFAGSLAAVSAVKPADAGRFQAALSLARAIALWKTGAAEDAQKAFDETVFTFPGTQESLSARYQLGRLFFESGQIGAAKDALISLLDDMSAQQVVGTSYFNMDDVTQLWFSIGQDILHVQDYKAVRDFHSAAVALMSQGHFLFFDATLYLREAEQLEALLPGLPPDETDAARDAIERKYVEAGRVFEKVLDAASGDIYTEALYLAGHSLYLGGEYASAAHFLRTFTEVKNRDERVPTALYEEAGALAALGSFRPAIDVCQANGAAHPTNIYAYRSILLQGDLYRALGGPYLEDAAGVYSRILTDGRFLASSPEWRRAIFSLGQTLYSLGRWREAVLKLDEALDRFPDDPEITQARYTLALACKQAAFADAPNRDAFLTRAAGLFGQIALAGAQNETQYAKAAAFLEADCYYDLADYPKALALYDRAVEANVDTPDATRALFQMANCYYRLGQKREAEATYKRAIFSLKRSGTAPSPGGEFFQSIAAWRTGEA